MTRTERTLDPAIVKEAAEAWLRAAKFVRARSGRGRLFKGESADAIIERVAPFRRDPELYAAYEREVHRRANEHVQKRTGRRTKTPQAVVDEIERLARLGLGTGEIARLVGTSEPTVTKYKRGIAA